MRPLVVLLGIVMGSTVSIAVALLLTGVVFLLLPEYGARLADETRSAAAGMPAVGGAGGDRGDQFLRGIAPARVALRGPRGADADAGGRPVDVLAEEVNRARMDCSSGAASSWFRARTVGDTAPVREPRRQGKASEFGGHQLSDGRAACARPRARLCPAGCCKDRNPAARWIGNRKSPNKVTFMFWLFAGACSSFSSELALSRAFLGLLVREVVLAHSFCSP